MKKLELISISDMFVNMYESSYENSGQFFYDYLVLGRFIFLINFIKDVIQVFDYDCKKIQIFMLGFIEFIFVVSQIEIVYNKLKYLYYFNVIEVKWRS